MILLPHHSKLLRNLRFYQYQKDAQQHYNNVLLLFFLIRFFIHLTFMVCIKLLISIIFNHPSVYPFIIIFLIILALPSHTKSYSIVMSCFIHSLVGSCKLINKWLKTGINKDLTTVIRPERVSFRLFQKEILFLILVDFLLKFNSAMCFRSTSNNIPNNLNCVSSQDKFHFVLIECILYLCFPIQIIFVLSKFTFSLKFLQNYLKVLALYVMIFRTRPIIEKYHLRIEK